MENPPVYKKGNIIEVVGDRHNRTYYILSEPKNNDDKYVCQLLSITSSYYANMPFKHLQDEFEQFVIKLKIQKYELEGLKVKLLADGKGFDSYIYAPEADETFSIGTWIRNMSGIFKYLIVAKVDGCYIFQNFTNTLWYGGAISPYSFLCLSQKRVQTHWKKVTKPKLCQIC